MKHLSILLLFVFFSISVIAQNSVTITGKIENPKSDKVYLMVYDNYVTYDKNFIDSAQLSDDGSFSMEVNWEKPRSAYFYHGNEQTNLYLIPGNKFNVTLNAEQFDETIKYSGVGAEVNNYLAGKILFRESSRKKRGRSITEVSSEEYRQLKDSALKVKLDFLNKNLPSNGNSKIEEFKKMEKQNLVYDWANDLLGYPMLYEFATKEEPELSSGFLDFGDDFKIDNPEMASSGDYISFLSRYINHFYSEAQKKDSSLTQDEKWARWQYDFIDKTITGEEEKIMLANTVDRHIEYYHNLEFSKKLLDDFESKYGKDEKLYKVILSKYQIAASLSPGNPAPGFTLPDLEGKPISLSDFKGKVVYMDIWASWCAPCLMEISPAQKLEEEFKDEDVVFLNVSTDQIQDMWKSAIKKWDVMGINVNSNGTDFEKKYNVNSIPHYVLIDREGKIIENFTERPSSGAKEKIAEALKQ